MIAEDINCKNCGTAGKLVDNQSWTGRNLFDEKIRIKAVCQNCGNSTGWYKTMDEAEVAWEKRNAP